MEGVIVIDCAPRAAEAVKDLGACLHAR